MAVAQRALVTHKTETRTQETRTQETLRELAGKAAPVTLAGDKILPVLPPFEPLLPGGLRRGTTVTVSGSLGLALAVIAGPSQAGAWCAAVGFPSLGLVAAAEAGIALERFPMVADPGDDWATVVGALLEAFDVVLLKAPAGGATRRLEARARERGAVLVVAGDWPGADVHLSVARSEWEGLGDGHGHLQGHRLEVVATGRRAAARERRADIWLGQACVGAQLPENAT
ncbi:MAG: hypothetical protein H0W70_13975 [Actinobacteria bacterium]|nr:hypothetical protein [Actinomycetota bacterium]